MTIIQTHLKELYTQNLDLMINEELEKKRINPDNLLKTANKVFENFEKERKVNNNYKLNSKAIINPWISDFNMGYMSWNMVINKATIMYNIFLIIIS